MSKIKMDSEEDRADLERHAPEGSGLNNDGPDETKVDLEESTETKHRTQKHCIWVINVMISLVTK